MGNKKHVLRIKSESGLKVEDIELIEIAAHFFLKELDKIKPIDKIRGEIIVVDEILSEAASEQLSGDMMEIKNHYVDNGVTKNYYVCRLADYINSAETIRTLAHELVHVWQTENGSLRTTEDNEWFWKGKSYGFRPYTGTDADLLLPWEKEADTLDLKLVRRFYRKYFSNW
jgi:hypothetical protein